MPDNILLMFLFGVVLTFSNYVLQEILKPKPKIYVPDFEHAIPPQDGSYVYQSGLIYENQQPKVQEEYDYKKLRYVTTKDS